MVNNLDSQVWWYKYTNFDDFEVNNVINEIDSHYNFEKIDNILELGNRNRNSFNRSLGSLRESFK